MLSQNTPPDKPFSLRNHLGADVSISTKGICLYGDLEAYLERRNGGRIKLTLDQAAALGQFLIAVTGAEHVADEIERAVG